MQSDQLKRNQPAKPLARRYDAVEYLQQSFPLMHERADVTVISGYSLLFHIAGSDPALKPVLLMGHVDVVPVDEVTMAEWTHDDGIDERIAIDDYLTAVRFYHAVIRQATE